MADDITLDTITGDPVVATDEVSSKHYQINKLAFGALDTANVVESTANNPLPVALSDTDNAVLDNIQTAVETIDDAVHADDAAFTLGTDKGVMVMGFAGTQSVDANDACAIACTTSGEVKVSTGAPDTGNTDLAKAEDAASA